MNQRYDWRIVTTLLVLTPVAGGLLYWKPWETEVWITTTPDAFVAPAVIYRQPGESISTLAVGITPAPWPAEADKILRAAKRGRVVHVTLKSNNATDTFDVYGMSPDGNLLIDLRSMSNEKRVSDLLLRGKEN